LRVWNLDLHRDRGSDRLSWRRLSVLLANLPAESATRQQMLGFEYATWGITDYLLAGVIDVLQGANWQRGGGKGQRPKPMPRPKSKPEIEEHNRRHAEQQERLKMLRAERKRVSSGG